jgi:hypothetical protein
VRDHDDDVLPRHAKPLLQGADRVGEVLQHVRGEDEVDGVVLEGELVTRSDEVDRPLPTTEPPFLLFVDRVHGAVLVDVQHVEAVVVVGGAADLDAFEAAEDPVHEH